MPNHRNIKIALQLPQISHRSQSVYLLHFLIHCNQVLSEQLPSVFCDWKRHYIAQNIILDNFFKFREQKFLIIGFVIWGARI